MNDQEYRNNIDIINSQPTRFEIVEFDLGGKVYWLISDELPLSKTRGLRLMVKNEQGLFDRARELPKDFLDCIWVYSDEKNMWVMAK